MERFLRTIYQKYLKFSKNRFFNDTRKYSSTLQNLKLSDSILSQFFNNYSKTSFIDFLSNIKTIIYSKNVYDFVLKNSSEDWDLWPYLKFLENEKIIKVRRNGTVSVLKKEILGVIPKPQTEEQIRKKIENKLKIKIKDNDPTTGFFKKFSDFEVKAKWDQMPISQSSAIFVVKKILENIPLKKTFLFVGDDDFVSVVLSLADPGIESLVIDADDQVLECVDVLAKEFKLKIRTKKIDLRKTKNLKEKFIGFLVNPVYTEAGVKEFVKFGKNQLGQDGGLVFLEVGDESIGNRFLFLQDWW